MFVLNHLAYLDPTTGGFVIQYVIGAAAGIAIFGRRAITGVGKKARDLFSRSKEN